MWIQSKTGKSKMGKPLYTLYYFSFSHEMKTMLFAEDE